MEPAGGRRAGTATRDATLRDLEVVASWVHSEEECRIWAGPAVSFPLLPGRLAAEIGFSEAGNLVVHDEAGPAAFGQVVPQRGGRAHLARVIVRPDARGRGLGRALVSELVARAASGGARLVSLNVYERNLTARRVYEALGFSAAPPDDGGGTPAPGIVRLVLRL